MKRKTYTVLPFKKFIPALAWFFLVNFLMLLPGKDIPSIGWLEQIYFDKWVHTGSFMVLTFLCSWILYNTNYTPSERWLYFIKIAVSASIWGLIIEFLQRFYIPGRSYDLLDWAADSFGALVGLLISRKYLLRP